MIDSQIAAATKTKRLRCSGYGAHAGFTSYSFACLGEAKHMTKIAGSKNARLLCSVCMTQARKKLGDKLLVTPINAGNAQRRVPGFVRRLQSWVKSLAHVFAKP